MTSNISKTQNLDVDLSMYKAGLKKSQLKNSAQISIFETIDKNNDSVLNNDEAQGIVKGKVKNKEGQLVSQNYLKVKDLENGRVLVVDSQGNEHVMAHDGTILSDAYVKKLQAQQKAKKSPAKNNSKPVSPSNLAKQFYEIADDNSGINSIRKMQKHLDNNVNSKNIMEFLDEYDKFKKDDSSIIDTVTSEVGASGHSEQKKVLMSIMDKLSQSAREAGVSESVIKKYNKDFLDAYNKEYGSSGAFRRTNPKDMEKALDSLRGEILTKQNSTGEISESEAIAQVKQIAKEEHNTAARTYNQGMREEGWAAKAGDTVCGWFGCNTREELKAKLGKNYQVVDNLINKSKTEAEFKANFEKAFGVPFDAKKIEARNNAIGKLQLASNLDNTMKQADKLLSHSDKWDFSDYKTAIKNNFKFDDATINQVLDSYAIQSGKTELSDQEKKILLLEFLKDIKDNASKNLNEASGGRSLEQMQNDVNLITRSAFGTSDVVKDGIQFEENQKITEMVFESGAEIAGTIALQAVPGLGQVAAARLAISASRWGTRAVKIANFAVKAETTLGKVSRFQQGATAAENATKTAKVAARAGQVASQMTSAGVATVAVDLSDGKSVKEIMHKTLMNMSFAGVGASSSVLAPKLMSAFGITDKALATEIAEEILNAAGSYGVTTLAGGEYGSTDAFIDFASGLIMSRVSHVKGENTKVSNIPTDANGNPSAGGLFGKKEGAGFFSKIADKFDTRTDYEKAAAARSAQRNQQAIDNGLDEAIAQGKVDPYVKNMMSVKGSNHSINDATLGNVVSERLVKALELEKQGKSFVKKLNNGADISQISKYISDGEVCSVNGKLYVNDNGTAIPIKMSQSKFEQLFPPLKCAAMQQEGGTHVCVATSQINSMLDTPGGRAKLFSMLEEASDGSITVNLANGRRPVKFPSGKPVKMNGRFISNAPDGVQMIEQAFMADKIKPASMSKPTDISAIDSHELSKQATAVENRRTSSDAARIIGGTQESYYNTYDSKTKTLKDNIRENFDKMLNDFVPGQDVMIAHWDGHAKAIVDYDKVNQIVTYRDPMSPGVDVQCTFLQFMHKGAHSKDGYGMYLSLQKRTPVNVSTDASALPTGYKESGTVTIGGDTYPAAIGSDGKLLAYSDGEWLSQGELARTKNYHWKDKFIHNPDDKTVKIDNKTPEVKPNEEVINEPQSQSVQESIPAKTAQKPKYEYKFEERTTQLRSGQFQPVAKTIDGNDIDAMVSSRDGSAIIRKDGKETVIPVENGESVPVYETGTDSYLIITKDNNGRVTVKTSETGDIPDEKALSAVSDVPTRAENISEKSTMTNPVKPKSSFISSRPTEIGKLKDGAPVMASIKNRTSNNVYTIDVNGHRYILHPGEIKKITDSITIKCDSSGSTITASYKQI